MTHGERSGRLPDESCQRALSVGGISDEDRSQDVEEHKENTEKQDTDNDLHRDPIKIGNIIKCAHTRRSRGT